jgi:hypothetical protein
MWHAPHVWSVWTVSCAYSDVFHSANVRSTATPLVVVTSWHAPHRDAACGCASSWSAEYAEACAALVTGSAIGPRRTSSVASARGASSTPFTADTEWQK